MRPMSLRAARVDAGLTCEQVGELTGYTAQTIRHWECGKTPIKSIALRALLGLYQRDEAEIRLPTISE